MNGLIIISLYLLIGYIIKLIFRRKLIKESFKLLSDDEYKKSPDKIYEEIIERVEKIEWEYDFPPIIKYGILWPITLVVMFLQTVFNFFENLFSDSEKRIISSEIKKYKKSNPQKFI